LETKKEQHIYQINVENCAQAVLAHILAEPSISPEIYQQHQEGLKIAVEAYNESLCLPKNISEQEKFTISLVKVNHPSFDYWFALFISTRKVYQVPLILDTYYRGDFGKIDNFIGRLQFFILLIIERQIPFYKVDIVNSIINWLREVQNKNDKKNVDENLKEDEVDLIKTDLDFEDVFDYFKALHFRLEEDNRLTLEEVDDLIYSNFYFKKSQKKIQRKRFNIKIEKQLLVNFVYQFHLNFDKNPYNNKLEDYSNFLIQNFQIFKNNKVESLKSNLSKPPKRFNPLTKK